MYLSLGWLPIPLLPREKRPAAKYVHFNDALPDPHTHQHSDSFLLPWQARPDLGVGVLLKPSNLVVVDCDSLPALEEAIRKSPPTLTVATRHGAHMYYRRPAGCAVGRAIHRGASGKVDILSNGYVVAPPSFHPTGHQYAWCPLAQSLTHGLPEAPEWAVEALSTVRVAASRSIALNGCPAPEYVADAPLVDWVRVRAVSMKVHILLAHGAEQLPTGVPRPDRSTALWVCINTLIRLGYSDASIARAVWNGPMGEKPRAKGWEWFTGELSRARMELLPERAHV